MNELSSQGNGMFIPSSLNTSGNLGNKVVPAKQEQGYQISHIPKMSIVTDKECMTNSAFDFLSHQNKPANDPQSSFVGQGGAAASTTVRPNTQYKASGIGDKFILSSSTFNSIRVKDMTPEMGHECQKNGDIMSNTASSQMSICLKKPAAGDKNSAAGDEKGKLALYHQQSVQIVDQESKS